jgi:small subunit ribosomal protein S17
MANKRKRLVGRVVSDKMEKTVVVAIDISKPHPIYRKVVRQTKKIYAHDETNAIPVGTVVRVVESKPLSKLKRWVVEGVVEEIGNRVVEQVAEEVQQEIEEMGAGDAVSDEAVTDDAPEAPEEGDES